jgi:hypothetical protein
MYPYARAREVFGQPVLWSLVSEFSNVSDRKRRKSEIPTTEFCHTSIKRSQKEMKRGEKVVRSAEAHSRGFDGRACGPRDMVGEERATILLQLPV